MDYSYLHLLISLKTTNHSSLRLSMRKILLILLLLSLLLLSPSPALADNLLNVYYAGPSGAISNALTLDKNIHFVSDVSTADVFVLNGLVPDASAIQTRVEQGAGLVLLLGPDLSAPQLNNLLGVNASLVYEEQPLSLNISSATSDPIEKEIIWTSAPQVRQRYLLSGSGFTPLVSGFEDGSLVLGKMDIGSGRVYLFTAFLNGDNPQFQDWAYFNYLIYYLVESSAGHTPLSFAKYPASPVPHTNDQIILYLLLAGLLLISGLAFWIVRRYSLRHPEALDVVVSDREKFRDREASTDWEDIGFHRPLAGFFMAFLLGILIFIPLIIYQNLILPVYLLPSAQTIGIWGRVTQFFALIWNFFDMGTSIAFIKFLSQYRVHDPRRAVQYGQVFVWWQALSGAVQVAIMVALAGSVLPSTVYAIYAWSIIIHTFIQIPGIYQVMRNALTGLQRFDYAQILDLSLAVIFPMLTQPILITLMVAWGKSHTVFGASIGGLLGLGMAAYAAELLTFLLGMWLYRRLGYNARLYFLAHFDWSVIKDSFRFGIFEMLGSAAWGIGQSVEILISQAYLVNYAEVWGNWVLAQNFVYAFNVTSTLYNNLMPSISEAISHGRKMLSQYYSSMGYKWGGMISAMLGALLLAVADRFILGASGPEFVHAAQYSTPLLIWGIIQYPSWVGDNVQLGTNKPWMKGALVSMEQLIRIILAFILLARLQINALIIAYIVALMTKNIIAYWVNHKLCFPQRFYFWQSLGAPFLAGLVHYAVVRWIGGLIWRGDQMTSILILTIAILPSYPIFAFFYGLFGGWNDATLEEVRRAVELSTFMKPFAWLFWKSTSLGARISPLHNRFPITNRQAALDEAVSLTHERVNL
jgi:O-antigen/teichoic acid export membrane protein